MPTARTAGWWPASSPVPVYHDPVQAAAQALGLAQRGTVVAADGTTLTLAVDTLCLHGDSPNALAMAQAVRRALDAAGIAVAAPPASPARLSGVGVPSRLNLGGVPSRSVPVGEIRRLGDHALLIGVADPLAARRLTRALTAARLEGVAEVVGGLATVMVAFDPTTGDVDARAAPADAPTSRRSAPSRTPTTRRTVAQRSSRSPAPSTGRTWPRWRRSWGARPRTVVALLTAQPLTVAVVGFSPGFAYLAGLPAALGQVPRRPRPRPSVPAGSVALANGYAAVYPSASPGGWQLIGHTDEPLFTPWEPPYARLAPGDRVRFVESARTAGNETGRSSTRRDGPGRFPEAPPPGSTSRVRGRRARPADRAAGRGEERAGRARGPGGRPGRSRLVPVGQSNWSAIRSAPARSRSRLAARRFVA